MTYILRYYPISVLLAVIILISQSSSYSFNQKSSVRGRCHVNVYCNGEKQQGRRMAIDMNGNRALVVGRAGGIAETISLRLQQLGVSTAVALDRYPFSPHLAESKGDIDVYIGDISSLKNINVPTQQTTLTSVADDRIVILCGDEGDETLRGPIDRNSKLPSSTLIEETLKILPKSVSSVVTTASVSSNAGALGSLFNSKSAIDIVKKWCQDNNKPLSSIRYGKLTGGITGMEALPFMGMPMLEPEIHPSYVLKSVVLADPSNNKYADSELCTRDSLSEALARLVSRKLYGVDALIVSIVGSTPTDKEWERLFGRVTNKENAELARLEFGAIPKPDALLQWLVDTWFPQALVEADAATVLTGARPVRAVKTSSTTVEIKWDDIKPDLSVEAVGSLAISLNPIGDELSGPYLSVIRRADKPLPGESQLTDKLIEGINKTVYKKGFCTPSKDAVSK